MDNEIISRKIKPKINPVTNLGKEAKTTSLNATTEKLVRITFWLPGTEIPYFPHLSLPYDLTTVHPYFPSLVHVLYFFILV